MDDKFQQISISDLINILIKRKKIIAISVVGFLLLGLLNTVVLTKQKYSSELGLEINNIKSTTTTPPLGQSGAVYDVIESITHANDIDFEAYLSEIVSDAVLEKTIKDLKLQDTYTTESLKSSLSISSDAETKKINLRLVSLDNEEGAKILRKLEENFSEHITKLSQENAIQTIDIIEKQMKIEKDKYSESLKEYKEAMKGNSSAYELELEIEGIYQQITEYKLNANNLEIKQDSIAAALEKTDSSSNSGAILKTSETSDYITMGSAKNTLEIDQAETQAKLKATKDKIKQLQDEIGVLQIDYQDVEFAESVIRQKVDITKQSYELFAQKYQELNMSSSIDLGGISINTISPVSPLGTPVGTRKVIKLAVFLVLGVMTGIILAFLTEYIDMIKAKRRNIK